MIHAKLLETRRAVQASFERTQRNGAGSSVRPDAKPLPLSCVVVGIEAGPVIESLEALESPTVRSIVQDWVLPRLSLFEDPDIFLGSWVDPDTGRVFFDFSKVFTDKHEGFLVARERGELAVFNTDLGKSVNVDEYFSQL